MSRRQRNDAPITLFSFQDIITSVTGILILITLILALTLVTQPRNESSENPDNIQALRSQLAALESDVSKLEQQNTVDFELLELMARFNVETPEQLSDRLQETISVTNQMIRDGVIQVNTGKSKTQEVDTRVDQKKAGLEQLLEQIKREQELLKKIVESNRVEYRLPGARGEEPWLIDIGGKEWLVAPANKIQTPVRFAETSLSKRLSNLEKWLQSLPSGQIYLVALVRSDGIESYTRIRESATLGSADFGVDLISDHVTVIDPQTGAAIR